MDLPSFFHTSSSAYLNFPEVSQSTDVFYTKSLDGQHIKNFNLSFYFKYIRPIVNFMWETIPFFSSDT